MKIFIIISLISFNAFANNSLIESKDINVPSERDEVISQGITSGEEIKSSVLNKKINATKIKQNQFSPAFFFDLNSYSEKMESNQPYSIDTPTLITIEKQYDDEESFLQIDMNYYLRVFGTGLGGVSCTVEVLFNGVSCDVYQTHYKNIQDASIQLHRINSQCLGLNKGTHNISVRKTRGTRSGAYYSGRCDFLFDGYGSQSIKVIETLK